MKRLTMKQIAQELGLSRTTVSLVLQQKGDQHRIAKETQERILTYARSAGFRPDYFASALNSRHSGVIGAVFPDVFESSRSWAALSGGWNRFCTRKAIP